MKRIFRNILAPSFECFIIGLQILVKEISTISATTSVAQLAEHRTRFAGSRVRFAAGRPKLHFRNRSRLGLKSRGIWVLYISFNICKTTIKHSKEGANMFLYTVYIYIYIYIYKGKNSIFYLDVFILISSLVWFLIDLREVTPKG